MARYQKPTRPAMSVGIATKLSEAAKGFRSPTDDDLKFTCALVLCAIAERYEISRPSMREDDGDLFEQAEAFLDNHDLT